MSVFAWTVSVVPLGIAAGAIDAFVRLASAKSRLGTTGLLRDREAVQATVGRAKAVHHAARAFLVEAMTVLETATGLGGDQLVQARAGLRVAGAHAAESALRIVDMLAADAGATAIFQRCPLERAVRDVQAAVKHVAMSPSSYTLAGRLHLGLDPGTANSEVTAMPCVRIATGTWALGTEKALIEAVQSALVTAFQIPEWDRDVVLDLYDERCRIVSTGRSERYTRIEIVGIAARSMAAKRALFETIADNLEAAGVPRNETRIFLIEPPAESWGIKGGVSASEADLGFKVECVGR